MILVHHLRVGRSVFTVWLLEELGLDYTLNIYDRNEMGRAPEALKAAHPLGKSPVIEDGDMTLAESGAIAMQLIEQYDEAGTLTPPPVSQKAARATWLQWLHYSEASAFAPLLMKLLVMRSPGEKPALFDMFATAEVALHLGYLQDALGEKDYILGDQFQAPDIGISYICSMAQKLGELDPYPTLAAYLERTTGRPAFARAMEKTGG